MMQSMASSRSRARVVVVDDGVAQPARADFLATEEPMETRLVHGGERRTIAVTMRTPGHDFELAAGFLHGEGVVRRREDIRAISYCVDADVDEEQRYNIVSVELGHGVDPDLRSLDRNFYTSSSCGVCGKASLDQLRTRELAPVGEGPRVSADVLYSLSDRLREAQGLFDTTGGLHAAGLFTVDGELLAAREDVGRHNAVDKLVGWALLQDALPLADRILMVSGRTSFEILQKAAAAGVPVVCAVSAPSSLAVDLAREFRITLVGFLRGRRFNVYAGAERISTSAEVPA